MQQIVSGPGFKFVVPAAPYAARNPRFRGADMTGANQTVDVTPQNQSMLDFRSNEVPDRGGLVHRIDPAATLYWPTA